MSIPLGKIEHTHFSTTTSATANETVPAKEVIPAGYMGAYDRQVWGLMGEGVYLEGATAGRDGINFPTAVQEILDATTVAETRVVKLTDSLYVIGLLVADTSFTAYACSLSGTTLTAGTAVHINTDAAADTDSINMCRVNDTTFAAVYRDEAGDDKSCVRLGTVSGTAITMLDELELATATETGIGVCYMPSVACVVVAYNTATDLVAQAIPYATTYDDDYLGTAGSAVVIEADGSTVTACCEMASGYVFVAFDDGSDNYLDAAVATVSTAGAIGTFGTQKAIQAKAPTMLKCVKAEENAVIVGWIEATTSNDPYIVKCTTAAAGTTITAGTPVACAAATATDFSFDMIDNTQGIAVWCDDDHALDLGYAVRFSVAAGTTTTVTMDSTVDKFTEATAKLGTLKAMDCACTKGGKVVIGYSGLAGDLYGAVGQYFENRIIDIRSTATSATATFNVSPIWNDRATT